MSFEKEFQHLHIPLKDIKLATNNFGNDHCIGRGGFGKVYNGELLLSCGLTMVAIKRLDGTLGQGAPEFWKEIVMLSQYKHENIVSLLGFCNESGESILVYEYLSNKSLDLYIKSTNLSWNQRLHICIGAARGLQYLHDPNGTQQRVLHRDIKSANILLDQNWNAKISDFGLSKVGPANQQYTFLVSNAVGTFGYCDPLYITTGCLTKESDIYSFGVVLFEVLCGRFCIENYEDARRFLTALAQRCYKEGKVDTIIKSDLKEQVSQECLERFSTIAYRCLHQDRTKRPKIAEIVKELQIALQYQSHLQKYRLAKYLPDSSFEGKTFEQKESDDMISSLDGSGMQITEALKLQMEVQKRLHEQLEVQRQHQLRIEAQGKYLKKIIEEQQRLGGVLPEVQGSGDACPESDTIKLILGPQVPTFESPLLDKPDKAKSISLGESFSSRHEPLTPDSGCRLGSPMEGERSMKKRQVSMDATCSKPALGLTHQILESSFRPPYQQHSEQSAFLTGEQFGSSSGMSIDDED